MNTFSLIPRPKRGKRMGLVSTVSPPAPRTIDLCVYTHDVKRILKITWSIHIVVQYSVCYKRS